jgi:hypothetical protein
MCTGKIERKREVWLALRRRIWAVGLPSNANDRHGVFRSKLAESQLPLYLFSCDAEPSVFFPSLHAFSTFATSIASSVRAQELLNIQELDGTAHLTQSDIRKYG